MSEKEEGGGKGGSQAAEGGERQKGAGREESVSARKQWGYYLCM